VTSPQDLRSHPVQRRGLPREWEVRGKGGGWGSPGSRVSGRQSFLDSFPFFASHRNQP